MNTSTQIDLTPLLSEKLAARFLSVSQRTLQAWRVSGTGPLFIKMGRAIRYCQSDLVNWMNSKRCSR
jgi:predicted DNA-binding transcriptional regulator AlpA